MSGLDPAAGTVTYNPAADYAGSDSFTFTVTDDSTAGLPATLTSPAVTVSIQVQAVNSPPVADGRSVSTTEDVATSIRLSGDDGDSGVTQALTFAIASGPSHGTLSGLDPATGMVTYTPTADYSGSDSFTFTVTDDSTAGLPATLTSAAATVSIQVQAVNSLPVADGQSVSTAEDTATTIRLRGDDGNSGVTQTLTFVVASGPSHGTLSGFDPAAGTVTYTPASDYAGNDSFTFTVTDDGTAGVPATLTSAAATVSIQVQSVNSPPVANGQNVTAAEDTATIIRLSGDDGDRGITQALTFAIASSPSHGTLSGFDAATGTVTYTPAADYSGSDSFTFTVTDDGTAGLPATLTSEAATVSIHVQSVNSPPVADGQSVSTTEGVATSIRLSGDDGNSGVTQTLTFVVASGPSHGTLSGFDPAAGTVTYTPASDYAGNDSFTFTVTDDGTAGLPATLTSAAATVSIQVQSVNSPPVANGQNVTTAEDTATIIRLSGDDGDRGITQTLTFATASVPSHGTLSGFDPATGEVTYTPAAGYSGNDSFTFTVTDDGSAGAPAALTSAAATVSILVQAVDHPPVPDDPNVTTDEGSPPSNTDHDPSTSPVSEAPPPTDPAGRDNENSPPPPPPSGATGGTMQQAMVTLSQALVCAKQWPRPAVALAPASAAARPLPPDMPIYVSPPAGFETIGGFSASKLLGSSILVGSDAGIDAEFGGGMIVTPESDAPGDPGESSREAPSSADKFEASDGHVRPSTAGIKKQDSVPASRHARRSVAQPDGEPADADEIR
jgi:tryptophan synthase alpha subunit